MNYNEQLTKEMQQTLARNGYKKPTPIQSETLAPALQGEDIVAVAQTGTGKTAAFAIPIIEKVFNDNKKIQALVLCPTRELALQITEVFKQLTEHKKLRVISVYGGQPASIQIRALRAGAQIVIGTPGRVKDLIARNVIKLKNVRFAVLDEADEMLDFGFLPDIKSILSHVTGEHQTMLFTATMNKKVSEVAQQFLTEPKTIQTASKTQPIELIRQMSIQVEDHAKLPAINQLMDEIAPRLTLIFCNTRRRAKHVAQSMRESGEQTACLHGDLTQKERDKVMQLFREGKSKILVATDVAARGIDVKHVDLVINYDVPEKAEYYVHRIGRTGRAGNEGVACTLVSRRDRGNLSDIKRRYNVLNTKGNTNLNA